jgi:transcriptional regulator with XRE-family HTH domain
MYNSQQESIMKSKSFGSSLREIREDGGISLRSLAKESRVDAAYLSRIERELNPAPKVEVIQKIAETLCQLMLLDTANCEKLKRTLLESSEQLANHTDLIKDLKHRFADRLRDEGVEESYIIDAIKKVSLESMESVLSGNEPLKIERESEKSHFEDLVDQMQAPGEEVHKLQMGYVFDDQKLTSDSASDYINRNANSFNTTSRESFKPLYAAKLKPTNKSTFKAGSRAVIEVDGNVSPSQEEQLKSIANLVRSLLKEK